MRTRSWLLAAALLSACPLAAQAQTGGTRAVPQSRPDQNPRAVRERQRPTPNLPSRSRARTAPVTAFVLKSVVVENSSLPADQLEAAWRPFVGRTLDNDGLVKVTDALAAVYEANDIAIYTVVVADQDFPDGVLKVRALEGYVDEVRIDGPAGSRNRALVDAYLSRIKAEKPLHRSTLQRYISLIRDIPGLSSEMDLQNGSGDAGVSIALKLKPDPVQIALSVNNRGHGLSGPHPGAGRSLSQQPAAPGRPHAHQRRDAHRHRALSSPIPPNTASRSATTA